MFTKFNMVRDINGYNGFGLPFTEHNYDTTLLSGVAQSFNVPFGDSQYIAIFSYEPGATVFVALNNTATLAGAAFAKSESQLNPVARLVKAGDSLSFITPNANAEVSVSLYAL